MDTVLLAREADKDSFVQDREFQNVVILGPAVIAPLEGIHIHGCTWEGDTKNPDAIFIEVEDNRPLVGVVGLRNVQFTNCVFRNIGIVGPHATIEFFRKGVVGGQNISTP